MWAKRETNPILAAISHLDEKLTPANLRNENLDFNDRVKERVTERTLAWKDRSIHGKFYHELNSNGVDKEMSCEWISRARD